MIAADNAISPNSNAPMLTWLASYPKSGNTWVRAFLAAYTFGDEKAGDFDLRLIPRISISESRTKLFAEVAGKPFEDLSDDQIDAYRQAVQQRLAESAAPQRVVKTHNARVMRHGTPLICRELTERAVYVVRNPLDVVDSFADHAGLSIDEGIKLLADRRHRLGDDAEHVPQYLDSWSQHVVSWVRHDAFPIHLVRYEDLLHDPVGQFRKLLQFLGNDIVEDRLAWAVSQTSFELLSKKEESVGFAELSPSSKSGKFFRRGEQQSWRSVLSPQQAARVIEDHAEAMQSVGYSTEAFEVLSAKACPANAAKAREEESSTRVADTNQMIRPKPAKQNPPAELFIPADWKRWIAENLLRGGDPEQLARILVDKGFPEKLSRLEVDAADSHPYLNAARKVLGK